MKEKKMQTVAEDIVVRHGKTVTIQCIKDDIDKDCVHVVVLTEQSFAPWSHSGIKEKENKADIGRFRPAALGLSCLIAIAAGAIGAFIVSLLTRIIL